MGDYRRNHNDDPRFRSSESGLSRTNRHQTNKYQDSHRKRYEHQYISYGNPSMPKTSSSKNIDFTNFQKQPEKSEKSNININNKSNGKRRYSSQSDRSKEVAPASSKFEPDRYLEEGYLREKDRETRSKIPKRPRPYCCGPRAHDLQVINKLQWGASCLDQA